jgi:hypothetical protein
MPAYRPGILLATLICLPAMSSATLVNRCEDAEGNITFTTLSCPIEHERTVQHAYNPPPGGGFAVLPPAWPGERYSAQPANKSVKGEEILVVGEWQDGCGNRLSAEQRRKAMMNRQTPPGMTRQDVENMLGRPDTIANRNGEQQYIYKSKEGRSDSVTFDEYGCVKERRQRR